MERIKESAYRVMVVEDDPELSSAVVTLLNSHPDFRVVAVAGTVAAANKCLTPEVQVLLLDLGLPDGSGLEILRRCRLSTAPIKILVFTVFADSQHTLDAIDAGADGYVLKDAPDLVDALRRTMLGEHPVSPGVTQHLFHRLRQQKSDTDTTGTAEVPSASLTRRERETLTGLAQGMSYVDIAHNLNISTHTLTDYSKSLYRKLGVNSRSEAVYEGVRQGLISFT